MSCDRSAAILISIVFLLVACSENPGKPKNFSVAGKDWPAYGGNLMGTRYSPLTGIDVANVKQLKLAWTYDSRDPEDTARIAQNPEDIQCQPIVIDGVVYGTGSDLSLFAVDGSSGKELWKFRLDTSERRLNNNRGVMYWTDNTEKRIFYTAGPFLYAVDAITGKLASRFGDSGRVDLHEGLADNIGHDVKELSVFATSPGVIYKNTIVLGSTVSEAGDAAPGHVRAFDAITGKLKWIFHTIPQPGEFGYDTWPKDAYKTIGAANNWAGMVLDEKRGVVYFGTGSPSADFYGGAREGANLFANCIIALEAETGKMKWYFQTIHHDLWDRDIGCPPVLTSIKKDGKQQDLVVQATKDGLVYVLDRDSGVSIFPIEERPVPTAGLPGEKPFPVQKFPLKPTPLSRQTMTEDDLTNISPEANAYAKTVFRRYGRTWANKFSPPSEEGTLLFGYSGGAEWGGDAADTEGIFYVNANEEAWELQMMSAAERKKQMALVTEGHALYLNNCSVCHGADRKGSGKEVPGLVGIGKRIDKSQIATTIEEGKGRMPSFRQLPADEREKIVEFLLNARSMRAKPVDDHERLADTGSNRATFPYVPAYVAKEWKRFKDQDGYNAIKPPWGTLNALDLKTGEWLWRIPLGEFPELTKKGVPITGTELYGGPIVTAGGLIFIAGTKDERIRALDKKTGKELWSYQLPAGGFATPATYEANGKQYVVIAAGGGRGQKAGGWYMAFAL